MLLFPPLSPESVRELQLLFPEAAVAWSSVNWSKFFPQIKSHPKTHDFSHSSPPPLVPLALHTLITEWH